MCLLYEWLKSHRTTWRTFWKWDLYLCFLTSILAIRLCLKFCMHFFPIRLDSLSLSLSLLSDVIVYQKSMREIVRTHGLDYVLYRSWFFFCSQIKEIEQEAHAEPETVQHKDTKQTAAVDLSKRLQDIRALNDASSLKGNCFLFF